jgi:hypothetical protein
MIAAYGRSAFFEFFRDELERKYNTPFNFLIDFNNELMFYLIKFLPVMKLSFAQDGNELIHYNELADEKSPSLCKVHPYPQVFQYKFGFVNGLSIVDLLFNVGNGAANYLNEVL